jgi:hypothetical protein
MTVTRSAGLPTGIGGYLCGSGYKGITDELDATVAQAADVLANAYGIDVVIRFNSDRRSGGAWLKTDEPDGVWLNAEVGICASLTTADHAARMAAKYPDWPRLTPGLRIYAHVGERVGERTHKETPTVADALAFVQANADLGRLTP